MTPLELANQIARLIIDYLYDGQTIYDQFAFEDGTPDVFIERIFEDDLHNSMIQNKIVGAVLQDMKVDSDLYRNPESRECYFDDEMMDEAYLNYDYVVYNYISEIIQATPVRTQMIQYNVNDLIQNINSMDEFKQMIRGTFIRDKHIASSSKIHILSKEVECNRKDNIIFRVEFKEFKV